MSEKDKIQKIIDGLPAAWREPGFDPHRGIERFRAATRELPESAKELDQIVEALRLRHARPPKTVPL